MSRAARSQFVGREGELHRISSLVERTAADGRGSVAVVEGAAGIGKSRLLQEVAGRARQRGAAVIEAGCHELEVERPFGAWVGASVPDNLIGVRSTIDLLV